MKTITPSSIANRTASVIASTLNLKSDQIAGLALVIQAALEESYSDRVLLLRALCNETTRWDVWTDGERGELCIQGLRYVTRLDAAGCPELNPNIRHALVEAGKAMPVQ